VDKCRGQVPWTSVVDKCRGQVSWTSVVDKCRGQVSQQVVGRDPQTTAIRSQSHRPGIDLWDDHQWFAVLQVEIDSNRHSQWGRVAGPCPSPSVNSDSRDAAEDAFCLREADGIHVSLS
jgi:hypothetical protein